MPIPCAVRLTTGFWVDALRLDPRGEWRDTEGMKAVLLALLVAAASALAADSVKLLTMEDVKRDRLAYLEHLENNAPGIVVRKELEKKHAAEKSLILSGRFDAEAQTRAFKWNIEKLTEAGRFEEAQLALNQWGRWIKNREDRAEAMDRAEDRMTQAQIAADLDTIKTQNERLRRQLNRSR
jgi:hypothetical protein